MPRLKRLSLVPQTRHGYGAMLFCISIAGYMFLYAGRGILSTCIPDIVAEGYFTKDKLGAVGTVFFLVYGAMQTPMGILADRVKPYIMITIGLAGASLFTLLAGVFAHTYWIFVFWGLNGLMQSCCWPSIVKLVSEVMPMDQRIKGSLSLALSGPLGSMTLYVVSAVVFSVTGWRQLFFVMSFLMIVWAAVVFFGLSRVYNHLVATAGEDVDDAGESVADAGGTATEPTDAPKVSTLRLILRSGFAMLLASNITFGIIREGINMWSPTLLVEKYGVSSVQAVLLSTFLPLIAAAAVPMAGFFLKKARGKELKASILFHLLTVLCTLLVLLLRSLGPALCIVLLAGATAMQGGVNAISMAINTHFGRYGKTGTMIGVYNTAAFAGNAAVSFFMGWAAQNFGWDSALWIWLIAAVAGLLFTAAGYPCWERFKASTRTDPAL